MYRRDGGDDGGHGGDVGRQQLSPRQRQKALDALMASRPQAGGGAGGGSSSGAESARNQRVQEMLRDRRAAPAGARPAGPGPEGRGRCAAARRPPRCYRRRSECGG
jgi:hypothetical protein